MTFPILSTGTWTDSCERACRVMQRTRTAKTIDHGGVFSCRKIDGSQTWSQHAWGNAVDLFPKGSEYAEKRARCYKIANAVVWQAKHRTVANNARKLDVAEVIDHENGRMWTPSGGWGPYGGNTGLHVHVTAAPKKTGTPDCA